MLSDERSKGDVEVNSPSSHIPIWSWGTITLKGKKRWGEDGGIGSSW